MNEAVDNNAPINQGVDMYGRQKPDLLSPRECAIIAAQAANEKKATDIMVQQVGDLIGVTEYFVICTPYHFDRCSGYSITGYRRSYLYPGFWKAESSLFCS